MLTNEDIQKLKAVFATKDDLASFATKDDLKNFATKDDLKNFATKDDLKNFASKDDLKGFATKDDYNKLLAEIINIKFNQKKFVTKDEFHEHKNEVLDKMDAIYKELKDMRQEQDIHIQMHRDIDKRLDVIESVPVIAHAIKK